MKSLVKIGNRYNTQGKECFQDMPVCSKMTPLCLYCKNKMMSKEKI